VSAPAPITFEEWKLVLLSPWGTLGVVLAIALGAVVLALSIHGYRAQARRKVLALLLFLRVLAVSTVVFFVLQPVLQLRSVTRLLNHVALLVDKSASMAVREERGGPTRIDRAAAFLEASRSRISSWRASRIVDRYTFGDKLRPVTEDPRALKPADEPATRISETLAEVRQRYRGRDLAGVLLVSDGIDNGRLGTGPLSGEARRQLEKLGVPVHAVLVGKTELRDLAIVEVYADEFAFVRNVVQIDVDLSITGLAIDRLPVTLEKGGQVVTTKEVVVDRASGRARARLEFVPEAVGQYVYRVSVPVYEGEAVRSNNSHSFLVRVIRDRIRVLQICGRPSWDEKFLRRLLKSDPNIDLISFFILRTPTDLSLASTEELSLIPFPTEELFDKELGSFDLVVLQNFNYTPYGIGSYLPQIEKFVDSGGALAMIGGDLSFSSGGYAGTPLARVLPVRLLPETEDPSRLLSTAEFRPRVTAEGIDHPILQLDPSWPRTPQALASLPPLEGANLVAGAASGATVLAVHPTLRDPTGSPMPVLAVGEAGKGLALALTTDSIWHWAFHTVGAGGTRQAYDRFWRNAIRWLIRDPELKYLRVLPQQNAFRLGAPLKIAFRAYSPDYRPAREVRVAWEIGRYDPAARGKGPSGVVVTDADGEAKIEVKLLAEGAYRVSASAVISGRKNTEEGLVLVEPIGPEERDVKLRGSLLRQISEATGGVYLGQASRLPDLPFLEPEVLQVNWRQDLEIWSRWWSFLLCLGLLTLDWVARRRFGYF
jgi:uncharacterized membrane protein